MSARGKEIENEDESVFWGRFWDEIVEGGRGRRGEESEMDLELKIRVSQSVSQ